MWVRSSHKGGGCCHGWIFGFRFGYCFAFCRGRVCVTCGSLVLFWVGAVLVVGLGAKVC